MLKPKWIIGTVGGWDVVGYLRVNGPVNGRWEWIISWAKDGGMYGVQLTRMVSARVSRNLRLAVKRWSHAMYPYEIIWIHYLHGMLRSRNWVWHFMFFFQKEMGGPRFLYRFLPSVREKNHPKICVSAMWPTRSVANVLIGKHLHPRVEIIVSTHDVD